jgi:hypothetical protein
MSPIANGLIHLELNRGDGSLAVLFGVMALLTIAATIAHSAPDEDQAVGQAMVTILGWTANLWRASVLCALGLSAVIPRRHHGASALGVGRSSLTIWLPSCSWTVRWQGVLASR